MRTQVASRLKEYLKQVLKSKNSLETFVDKVKVSIAGDPKAKSHTV